MEKRLDYVIQNDSCLWSSPTLAQTCMIFTLRVFSSHRIDLTCSNVPETERFSFDGSDENLPQTVTFRLNEPFSVSPSCSHHVLFFLLKQNRLVFIVRACLMNIGRYQRPVRSVRLGRWRCAPVYRRHDPRRVTRCCVPQPSRCHGYHTEAGGNSIGLPD